MKPEPKVNLAMKSRIGVRPYRATTVLGRPQMSPGDAFPLGQTPEVSIADSPAVNEFESALSSEEASEFEKEAKRESNPAALDEAPHNYTENLRKSWLDVQEKAQPDTLLDEALTKSKRYKQLQPILQKVKDTVPIKGPTKSIRQWMEDKFKK